MHQVKRVHLFYSSVCFDYVLYSSMAIMAIMECICFSFFPSDTDAFSLIHCKLNKRDKADYYVFEDHFIVFIGLPKKEEKRNDFIIVVITIPIWVGKNSTAK